MNLFVNPADADATLISKLRADGLTHLMILPSAGRLLHDEYDGALDLVHLQPYAYETYGYLSGFGPSAARPSAAGPSAAGPSAAGPSAADPSTAGPCAAGPSAARPGAGARNALVAGPYAEAAAAFHHHKFTDPNVLMAMIYANAGVPLPAAAFPRLSTITLPADAVPAGIPVPAADLPPATTQVNCV